VEAMVQHKRENGRPNGHREDLADLLGDMISAHAPDGTYRYVSAAAKELLGYEPGELIGTSSSDYFHPDDVAKVEMVHRSTLEGAPFTASYRLRRKDGDYVWVETTTRAVADETTGEVAEILCCTRPLENRLVLEKLGSAEYQESIERLQRVMDEDRIGPVYQPIFELETERVIAYEALSRFPGDPARGPDKWFAEAWDVGLGLPLEMKAVSLAARALPHLPPDVNLCVNASPETAASRRFVSTLGNAADRVVVELTEHVDVGDYDGFAAKLSPLRQAGGKIAIDDFGAGYASLRHILKVRPEWIKLDISLVERIHESPVAHALASSLITFADEVGVRVIAEGIETVDELDALLEIGFRYGQGFYFGLPAPLDEALAASG
jgi:PAS domain S-box-containing protein